MGRCSRKQQAAINWNVASDCISDKAFRAQRRRTTEAYDYSLQHNQPKRVTLLANCVYTAFDYCFTQLVHTHRSVHL